MVPEKPEQPDRYFLENIEESYERSAEFQREVEDYLREKAVAIEKNLENSVESGGQLEIKELNFYTGKMNADRHVMLMADSLVVYCGRRGENVAPKIREKLRKINSDNGDSKETREEEILREFLKRLDNNAEEYLQWLKEEKPSAEYICDSNIIFINRLDVDFLKKADIPPILRPLCSFNREDEDFVNASIAHELTHAWLYKSCESYTSGGVDEAINEVFAHLTTYFISGKKYEQKYLQIYDEPELIDWGTQIAIEKFEELRERGMKRSVIDFSRDMQIKIYENATQSGEARFEVLLRGCLLEKDKRRLQEFRDIDKRTKSDLDEIEKILLKDTEEYLEASKKQELQSKLEGEFKWEEPSQMEEKILEEILSKIKKGDSSEIGGLEWVNHKITEKLEERRIVLKRYLDAIEKVEQHISDDEFLDDLRRIRKQLFRLEEQMGEIISKDE